MALNNKKTGEFISTLRKRKGLTQKELSEKLAVTDKAVSKWERGMGYPDISLLKPLSEILETSISEILDGGFENAEILAEHTEKDEIMSDADKSVVKVLVYADEIIKGKNKEIGRVVSTFILIGIWLCIFICILIDFLLNRSLSWSWIVTSSCLLGGGIMVPPFLHKRKGMIFSVVFTTIFLIPYLGWLSIIIDGNWFWPVAVPISILWLAVVWAIIYLAKTKKLTIWFLLCAGMLLSAFGSDLTNRIIDKYVMGDFGEKLNQMSRIITFICSFTVAGVLFIIGLFKRNKK